MASTALRKRAPGRWVYLLLLTMQTVGAVVLYWKGLPLYRHLVGSPTSFETRKSILEWALFAIALIQVGYWTRYWIRPALPLFVSVVLGHVILFLSRMSFIVATSVFSFVFISKRLENQMSAVHYGLTIAGLFSLFCYMQELQGLGNALQAGQKKPD